MAGKFSKLTGRFVFLDSLLKLCTALHILANFILILVLPAFYSICDSLSDLAPVVQFKESEKHPWRSVTFNKVKSNTPPWVFFRFFN